MTDRGFASQKVWSGVAILVRHPGPIQERLVAAYVQVAEAPRTAAAVGADAALTLEALHASLTKVPGHGIEASIAASVAKLTTEEAVGAAASILNVALQLDEPPHETDTQANAEWATVDALTSKLEGFTAGE